MQVEYDFEYYKLEMSADVQLLILSEAKSSILPADLVLPFSPRSVASINATSEDLQAWRWYLATMRSLPSSIEPEMNLVLPPNLEFLSLVLSHDNGGEHSRNYF